MNQNDFVKGINEFYPPKTEEQLKRWKENSPEILRAVRLMFMAGQILSQTMKKVKYGQEIDPSEQLKCLSYLESAAAFWGVTPEVDVDLSLYADPIHFVTGLAEESVELMVEILEPIIVQKPYDSAKIADESGDVLHYFTKFTEHFHLSHHVIRDVNYTKCSRRFKNGYSDEAAIAKADQNEG
jgi:hypothetical protein